MPVTVAKLKRALEETAASLSIDDLRGNPMVEIAADPTSLTILAEKLSERHATAHEAMLEREQQVVDDLARRMHQDAKLGTPTNYIARKDCPTQLGDACQQGQQCCQRNPEWIASGEPDVMAEEEALRKLLDEEDALREIDDMDMPGGFP